MEFDADPNIFVMIAHDGALLDVLPLFNDQPEKDLGNWAMMGWKEAVKWAFLAELPLDRKPARPPLVEGLRGKITDN
jgi:hypothetical protein